MTAQHEPSIGEAAAPNLHPRVSVLIPAYNEQERLPRSVELYYPALRQHYGSAFELLILANGCSDHTFAVAQTLATTRPEIIARENPARIGKGGAILWGFSLARAPVVAFVDADGSTAAHSLISLLETVEQGADVAIGSRWLPASVIAQKQPLNRRILSRIFNLLARGWLGLPFRDTQCGAKAFRRELLLDIEREIESRGWAFDVELLYRLRRRHRGIIMREVAIEWNDVSGSRLRAHTDGPSMLRDLLRIRLSSPRPPAVQQSRARQEGAAHESTHRRSAEKDG